MEEQKKRRDWDAEENKLFEHERYPFLHLMAYYRCAIMELETKFNVLNIGLSESGEDNPIETIKSRLKTPQSILRKLQRRGLPLTVQSMEEHLYDVAGIRVVCSFTKDIYRLADMLMQQDDIVLLECKDYIKHPKPSGYRSLHLIVEVPIFLAEEKKLMKAEVQLRTIAMDFWASLEHKLRYKKSLGNSMDMQQIYAQLRDCADISAELDRRMELIRNLIAE